MAFLSHRCRRCWHPEYWAQEATRAGSAPRGFPVNGAPLPEGSTALHRVWCKQCPQCQATGCDYDPDPYEVEQWLTNGKPVVGLFKPGEETTGAKSSAGKTYACCCDTCKRAYAAVIRSGVPPHHMSG